MPLHSIPANRLPKSPATVSLRPRLRSGVVVGEPRANPKPVAKVARVMIPAASLHASNRLRGSRRPPRAVDPLILRLSQKPAVQGPEFAFSPTLPESALTEQE